MADKFIHSNPPTLLDADHDITNQNPAASESVITGSWGSSSSSFLNTSFGSELDSSDTDNDDDEFIAELTRQMADYMLQEDDDDNNTSPECYVSPKPISQVENQSQHRVEQKSRRRRKGKMTASTQQMKSSGLGGGRLRPVGYGPLAAVGSGMRAIFLDGSGSNSRSTGTGVFLPRSATDATAQNRKKPGCSTVLVPTRVLQALQHHFNNKDSFLQSNNLLHIQPNHQGQRSDLQQMLQVQSTSSDHLDKKLPQDWTC